MLDVRAKTMGYLEDVFGSSIETLYSNPYNIEESVRRADLVVGAVLIPGAVAPKLVDEELIAAMEKGSVVVDVAVDQGGCIETCRPTDHDHPTYEVHGVVHYCVPNMPGAVAQTSTWALTNVTIEYAQKIADMGVARAVIDDPALASGVNCYAGNVTCSPVALAHELAYSALSRADPADLASRAPTRRLEADAAAGVAHQRQARLDQRGGCRSASTSQYVCVTFTSSHVRHGTRRRSS